MLNNDNLSQLAQLKQDIIDSKEYGIGRVVGSNGRFGFVKLDDGRDVYLSPDKMQRVIPGDTVKVCIETNKKDKLEATLEKLITPAIGRFVGQYRIKGKTHFVQPTGAQASRWIFIPPKQRDNKIKEGDYVIAKITTHPFKDGKAAAKIVEKIGSGDEPKFELTFVKAKYSLNVDENKPVTEQCEAITTQFNERDFGERKDLSDLPFVTIDAETTRDMDDALAIEPIEDNPDIAFRLHVAIADPSHFIAQGSPLSKRALAQGQSAYLLGGTVPMLPTEVSHQCFSLLAGEKRPALVCHLDINDQGEIQDAIFEFAIIESKHKLSYESVAAFLEQSNDSVPEECKTSLNYLKEFALQRRIFREKTFIVSPDQTDFDYHLNEQGQIDGVSERKRTIAHQIVEESMLATNTCAAYLLAEHAVGVCNKHKGFRPERLGEVKALLKEENIEHGDLQTLEDYVKLFKDLSASETHANLSAPLRRMMDTAELSSEFGPHLGMGVAGYTTITSPIRRYADLYNHWALQKILEKGNFAALNDDKLSALSETLQNIRQADRELTLWLVSLYTDASRIGHSTTGTVRIVTQQGFGVRLLDTGIEGFVLFPKDKEKQYDAKRMTLTVDDEKYEIGKEVSVTVKSVNKERRQIAFELSSTVDNKNGSKKTETAS